ncbi:MAG: NAD+ synthase [Verrucomicrobiota bacterium]
MKIGLAQLNPTVGDLHANSLRILEAYHSLSSQGADLVLTPELALTGYPPQDLLFNQRFLSLHHSTLLFLHQSVTHIPLIVGCLDSNPHRGQPLHNAAAILERGKPLRFIHKSRLPNYDVFQEDRYFEPASHIAPVAIAGSLFGITICEDLWTDPFLPRPLYHSSPIPSLIDQGATALLNLSASPFSTGKPQRRLQLLQSIAAQYRVPIFYCNAVGGNDQLIFDGRSLAINSNGSIQAQLASFQEDTAIVELHPTSPPPPPPLPLSDPQELFLALSLGTRDYLHKCHFHSAILGLSGGIDSAVTAAIAAHALGNHNVLGVTMPTQFSSPGSVSDSLLLAKNLHIRCETIPIQPSFDSLKSQLHPFFQGLPEDTTEENLQPRIRGLTLMALANKFQHLLLSTGNKSELAVGYCTLYGDMCGGLSVLSDVPKTAVYQLAHYINRHQEIIPHNTITKPPSAELKPLQRDDDSLPPYPILDPILQAFVEDQLSIQQIVDLGFPEKIVRWVVKRVVQNEFKRAQSVPGLKVSPRAFGIGRRMPVAQNFID